MLPLSYVLFIPSTAFWSSSWLSNLMKAIGFIFILNRSTMLPYFSNASLRSSSVTSSAKFPTNAFGSCAGCYCYTYLGGDLAGDGEFFGELLLNVLRGGEALALWLTLRGILKDKF